MPQINVAKAWHLPYCLPQPLTAGQPCINKKNRLHSIESHNRRGTGPYMKLTRTGA